MDSLYNNFSRSNSESGLKESPSSAGTDVTIPTCAVRQAALAKRTQLRERLREAHGRYGAELIECREVTAGNPLQTWPEFLLDLARGGDERALAVIRHRTRYSRAAASGDSLSAVQAADDSKHVILPTADAHVEKGGDVVYRLKDGGVVVDGPASVRVLRGSCGAMSLALVLAQERFANQRLVIDGTETFGAWAAHAAGEQGLDVSFADERFERLRQAAGSASEKARRQPDIESYIYFGEPPVAAAR